MTSEELSLLVTAAAAGVTAIATGVLAWVTWLLFSATKRMAQATHEPHVVATIEPTRWSATHLDLRTENTGTGAAYDVQLAFEQPLLRERGGEKILVPLNAISILRPGQAIQNFIGAGAEFLANRYTVTISWRNAPNQSKRTTVSYGLDLGHFEGLVTLGSGDPLVQISQELKKFREDAHRVLSGFKRLGVDIFDGTDRKSERAALEARFASEDDSPKP